MSESIESTLAAVKNLMREIGEEPKPLQETLVLPEAITIHTVLEVQARLLETLITEDALVIDGSNVMELDAAGVQLLLSLTRSVASRGRQVEWAGASDKLIEVTRILDMNLLLGIKS